MFHYYVLDETQNKLDYILSLSLTVENFHYDLLRDSPHSLRIARSKITQIKTLASSTVLPPLSVVAFPNPHLPWLLCLRIQAARRHVVRFATRPRLFVVLLSVKVQLQHHARHRLPTFQLIFVHVIESLVFVPFYDDQLLAFMVLILIWLCELFTLISVRTPISIKFFPRFFLLYFLVFHIYFFFYSYGFSYLALSTTAAFMQHLILYFWNRFEVRNDKGWKELQSGKRPFLTG
ncbi:hypothetical protein AHAS_Ahas05G0045500 [Arachis hypogaea]